MKIVTKKSAIKLTVFSVLFFILTGCFTKGPLGSRDNPIKLYFTPSVDADTIATNSVDFLRFIEKETGLYFESAIPTSYIAVVEAFGSLRADISVMNSFGYLMANKKYGALAKLKVLRYGHDYYQGQIIVRADSGIDSVSDLAGKKFAYTDPSSTSGYMFPLKTLTENSALPSEHVFAGKHDNVVTMVYQGQVDGGATYYSAPSKSGKIRDARARVKTQFPDVEEKVKILFITDKIPNDPFVFRKDLPQEISDKFIVAVKKFIKTPRGKQIFKDIYSVGGLVDATDADYQPLRDLVSAINVDLADLVSK